MGRGSGEVLWLVWGPIPVPTGKFLSTAIAFYIHREIREWRDELVTNLQGYLKVSNVNPQAVNFKSTFICTGSVQVFETKSLDQLLNFECTISFLSAFIVPNLYT